MFTRAVATGLRAASVAHRAAVPSTTARTAVRSFTLLEKDTTKVLSMIEDCNADLAVDFPKFPVWGPRVPLAVTDTYEADTKSYFENHWDEIVDMDLQLRKTAQAMVDTLPPKVHDKLEVPHPKAALGVSDATEKYFDMWMGDAKEQRILVPLCGGWSAEMGAFAAMGHRVVGVEYVRAAVDALNIYEILPEFQEEGWRESFLIHHSPESGAIVAEGDFFDASPDQLGTFDKVFDRCGITSVPQGRIGDYVKVLDSLMNPGATLLMETMSASGDSAGANDTYSWCTPEAMAKAFGGSKWEFKELETSDVSARDPYSSLNLNDLKQHFFLITKKA